MIAMKALPKALLFAPRSAHRLWPLLALLAAGAVGPAQGPRIKEVAAGQGGRRNQLTRLRVGGGVGGARRKELTGYGLVVGLDGTGDQTTQMPYTTQALSNYLQQMGLSL